MYMWEGRNPAVARCAEVDSRVEQTIERAGRIANTASVTRIKKKGRSQSPGEIQDDAEQNRSMRRKKINIIMISLIADKRCNIQSMRIHKARNLIRRFLLRACSVAACLSWITILQTIGM